MHQIIDLRSDTVTTPTQRMRDAMHTAPVGDDVLGEDPTVIRLEEMAAEMFDKEAALFVGSGTMANQIAVLVHCARGDQVVVHDRSHIYNLELGGIASTAGVQTRAIPAPGGIFNLSTLEQEIHKADIQRSPTTLICLENTFDLNRGLIVSPEHTAEVGALARRMNIHTHLDGARVLNAAVASKRPVRDFCEAVDSVCLCLSKALACPVGSMLMGEKAFIDEARRMRQRLGGGWRQAGILAAAGIVAFEEMIDRLEEDHQNAQVLAKGLKDLGLGIDMAQVQTNVIHVDLSPLNKSAEWFCKSLGEKGIKAKNIGQQEVRMITHKDIDLEDIKKVFEVVSALKK